MLGSLPRPRLQQPCPSPGLPPVPGQPAAVPAAISRRARLFSLPGFVLQQVVLITTERGGSGGQAGVCCMRLWPRVFCCGGCRQTVMVVRPGIFSGMQPSDQERLWAFRTRAGSLGGPAWWLSAPLLGKVLRASLLPLAVEWGHFSSQAGGEELTGTCTTSIPGQGGLPLPSGVSNARLPCRQAALETSPFSPATVSASHTTCGHLRCPVSSVSHTDNERGAVVPPCGCGNSSKVTQPGFGRAKTSHPAGL